jgi:hypothetical protein
MCRFRLFAVSGLLGSLVALASASAADPPAVPDDFKLVAKYAPGYSNWRSWETTVTADGKVAHHIGRGGRGGGEPMDKDAKLTKEDVAAIYAKVADGNFFKLKEQYKTKVTDQATLTIEITADKKTHKVQLYGYQRLTEKDDQDAADRFLVIWQEVLKKVHPPNADQKVELYKPGNYVKPKKDK